MSNFTRIVKTQVNLWKFHVKDVILWIWHSFSRAHMRNFFWCYYRWFFTSLERNAICFKFSWYKIFVHWKLKLLNSLVDSVLKYLKEYLKKDKEHLNYNIISWHAGTAWGQLWRKNFGGEGCSKRRIRQGPGFPTCLG